MHSSRNKEDIINKKTWLTHYKKHQFRRQIKLMQIIILIYHIILKTISQTDAHISYLFIYYSFIKSYFRQLYIWYATCTELATFKLISFYV
jgi:hypothetical protein